MSDSMRMHTRVNSIKDISNPMIAVEEHRILAEAIPRGVVDGIRERMPV
jgi:hypothetical protein